MSQPSAGQPYNGMRFSVGDLKGTPGTPAYKGVNIGATGDVAPPTVLSLAKSPNFTLTIYLRGADNSGGGWLDPAILAAQVEYRIRNVETGAYVGPFAGGTIAYAAAPTGSGTPDPGYVAAWFAATSPAIATGAAGLGGVGTYHVLATVRGTGVNQAKLAAYHDHTYIMVTP